MHNDFERQVSRIETRAENLSDLPALVKMGAAVMLFTDTRALLLSMLARIGELEGRANGS